MESASLASGRRSLRSISVLFVSLATLPALVGACSSPAREPTDGFWAGAIETEGDVTTVVNESGSVWRGAGQLVEELSIGRAEGPEEELFGPLGGVAMIRDRIFVLDTHLRKIRSYDAEGGHLADCGGRGQGPGELDPAGFYVQLGASEDGRVFAHAGSEIEVFSADCESLGPMPVRGHMTLGAPLTVSYEGVPYLAVPVEREGRPTRWAYGMQAFDHAGAAGEPIRQPTFDFEPTELELQNRMNGGVVATTWARAPYEPEVVWNMMPSGAVVGGVSDAYRFEVLHPDGHRTVVENPWWQPVPLTGDEADWYARRFEARLSTERVIDPPAWDASDLAQSKPAFQQFLPDRSGRLWVLRPGPGERVQGCTEDAREYSEFREAPCWREPTIVEVFGADGRFLGRVDVPEEMSWSPRPWIRDDDVLATAEDEAGTIMVKRYRLVVPR